MIETNQRIDRLESEGLSDYKVGYKRPPLHTRFKPGQSGNPSGRAKGAKNLKTLFNKILNEEVSLREGANVRKVSKAEAVLRGLVIGALKGDARSLAALFRVAEHTGQFEEELTPITRIESVIVTGVPRNEDDKPRNENVVPFPAAREVNTD
jgi:hypothetical protein